MMADFEKDIHSKGDDDMLDYRQPLHILRIGDRSLAVDIRLGVVEALGVYWPEELQDIQSDSTGVGSGGIDRVLAVLFCGLKTYLCHEVKTGNSLVQPCCFDVLIPKCLYREIDKFLFARAWFKGHSQNL